MHQRISLNLVFSSIFFFICWQLDYYITNISAHGDFTEEANIVARYIWKFTGVLRFIEIPVWSLIVLVIAGLINSKSKFLALLWLNFSAFQSLFGFITWLPRDYISFIYTLPDWATGYGISLMSIILGIVMTFIQTRVNTMV